MPIREEEMLIKTDDYFVSESHLNPRATFQEITAFLKKRKAKGVMTCTVNEGGTQGVLIVERTKLNDRRSESVREVLENKS